MATRKMLPGRFAFSVCQYFSARTSARNQNNKNYYGNEGTFVLIVQGRFCGGGASVYVGEWANGARSGYGVSDDIVSGEKYMGLWASDMKTGHGCVVTLDGVYYEGNFYHNKMTGKGLMLFEVGHLTSHVFIKQSRCLKNCCLTS
jgi:hypothetical protein